MMLCDGSDEAACRAVHWRGTVSGLKFDRCAGVVDDRRGVEQDLRQDGPEVVDVVVEDVGSAEEPARRRW